MTKWNTYRIAGYGAAVGCLFSALHDVQLIGSGLEATLQWAGGLVGGAAGGALMAAAVSGLRNLIIR